MNLKNFNFQIIFSLVLVVLCGFSCSSTQPKIASVHYSYVYEFTAEKSACNEYMSVFVKLSSDENRVSALQVYNEELNYEWDFSDIEKVKSGKNCYVGYSNLVMDGGKSFPDGEYLVTYTDLAQRQDEISFTLKKLDSMKTKDDNFVTARDVRRGKAGKECTLKRMAFFDADGNELFCGNYNEKMEDKAEIAELFPSAKYSQIFYTTKDSKSVIILPKEKI